MRDLRISLTLPLISTFNLGTVTNKLGGGSTALNNILQRVDKLLFGSQGIYITNSGGQANKKSWAIVTPESTAGTSEYTVLVASASSGRWTFKAGNSDL
jgi:hypothetical protein